jgi:hypothetical protein
MCKHRVWVRVVALALAAGTCALALAASGCGGGGAPDEPPPQEPVEEAPRLGDHIDTSLAELLANPRAQLAEMADDLLAKARLREKAHRETNEVLLLLPDLHLPLVVPVLREAKFSAKAGLSLPPYLAAGTPDRAVALHLARHGDVEAARRLADPADANTLRQIAACAGPRNYPVEWTRLVGLLQHTAESRLATGDLDGAKELIQLHRQLREVLDAKAAAGPLGGVLLPRGREVLSMAEAAWRAQNQDGLADQVKDALAAWGDVPAPSLRVPLGAPRAEVTRLLGGTAQGRVLAAPGVGRALDLLGLPFPQENVDGVFAFFNPAGGLSQVLVAYHAKTAESFPRPADLALLLRERLPGEPANPGDGEAATADNAGSHGLRRHVYPVGDVACDVTIVSRNGTAGALVRCVAPDGAEPPPALPRDFGAAHLDRSFEQNRLRVTPEQRAEEVRTDRAEVLAGITNLLPALPVSAAVLQRVGDQDLLNRVTLSYAQEDRLPLPKVALPLWAAWGPGQLEGVDDDHGGHLAFRWEDARTRCTLRLPHDISVPLELELADRHTPEDLPRLAAEAVAFDRAERGARFAAGKVLTRLPRGLEVDAIQLGMTRPEVEPLLPGGKGVATRAAGDGLVVTFAGEPSRGATYVARQLFLRFDGAGRLAEVRARYQDTSPANAPARGLKDLLAALKKRGGAPADASAPWARLWPDLPARKPAAVCWRWQDDATLLTYQADSGGAEVAVRDCPADHPAGALLPPLEYLPRGPERCSLGDTGEALLSRWGVAQPVAAGGALVLTPPQPGPYDALLVWFEKGQAVRIVARHAPAARGATQPSQLADAVQAAWVQDLRTLSWPRRRDVSPEEVLQGFGWHDERTRVRLFWQEPDQGPGRLYTEWKSLP